MARIPDGVRAVFFDAVGTLLFPEPSAPTIYAATASRHGLNLSSDEVRTRFMAAYRREEAIDIAAQWATNEARERDRWHRIVCAALAGVSDAEGCFDVLFDHFAQPTAWRIAPDAAVVLSTLQHRGFVLGMGSNYDARLCSVMAGFPEFAPLRDRVLISASLGVRKPGAGFFREVMRTACSAPSEVLFIGDDLQNDYAGATAAGLRALLLDPDAKHSGIAHRITRLTELLQ